MARGEASLVAALEHLVSSDDLAVLEDEDLLGQALDLHRAPAGAVGHGVEVATDADHAVAGDPPLQLQDRTHPVTAALW
jgi:hypothetical protein